MNFNQTIDELYSSTEKITVYAGQACSWIDGKTVPDIGIRSFFAGQPDNDPVVDNVRFMVCGTVYIRESDLVSEVKYLKNVKDNISDIFVRLRAMASGYPIVAIDLGQYRILNMSEIDRNGHATLDLKRM